MAGGRIKAEGWGEEAGFLSWSSTFSSKKRNFMVKGNHANQFFRLFRIPHTCRGRQRNEAVLVGRHGHDLALDHFGRDCVFPLNILPEQVNPGKLANRPKPVLDPSSRTSPAFWMLPRTPAMTLRSCRLAPAHEVNAPAVLAVLP